MDKEVTAVCSKAPEWMREHPNAPVVAALKAALETVVAEGGVKLFLSRRNLETLIAKLDVNRANPGESLCTLIKWDTEHPTHPQSHRPIVVTAVEDEEYYTDRSPGRVLHFKPRIN